MDDAPRRFTGGCLCRAVRYEAVGEPAYAGHCYCADCRKASGSGFIPFIGFPRRAVQMSGETVAYVSRGRTGGPAKRNACPKCSSLVFGGEIDDLDDVLTLYAGSLDDPHDFRPTIAIFTEGRPAWAVLPPELLVIEEPSRKEDPDPTS